ncbi:hypothetical protein C1H46_016132 [Malus baccata]|uniref:EamA domain-containing protein n=1 Tax=Malus baccata TaxID=106549 RepID=A0A540MHT6_MALBA|nr:hypothetical protein C1H46_016132 [Malus baccata]
MNSPFIRELGGENGGESSISASGSGGGYDEIRSDDGDDEQTSASASCGGDDEISSEDGNDEQSTDEEDVSKPPIASTRSAWGRVAQWIIGVSIPLIARSTTVVCTRLKGITFDVFNFFTNKISFLMLLLATIILSGGKYLILLITLFFQENTIEKYDVEALWLATIGISAGLVQYLGTTLTKKTDVVFVSSFTPISIILVIGLSAMIFHDRIKKPRKNLMQVQKDERSV